MTDQYTPPKAPLDATQAEWFGHPRALAVLFNAEMWDRFRLYGMRALLVLYMVSFLGYDEADRAYPIYGAYGALVYAFPVVGGWVANTWLGYSRCVVLGGIIMAFGQFCLASKSEFGLFAGLAFLCVGNGLFKPNISSTVGRLYEEGDPRRDRGFTIFYMGINIGALVSPLVCGPLGEKVEWCLGFILAGFGMLLGLIWYWRGQKYVGEHGEPPNPALLRAPAFGPLSRLHIIVICAFLTAPLAAVGLYYVDVATYVIQAISLVVLGILISMAVKLEGVHRLRLCALMVLMVFHMLFWSGFEQAGSSFNIMTDKHVDRNVFGFEFAASVFQSVNPFFIVALAPLFTLLWHWLERVKLNPSVPLKFAYALVQLGIGFLILVWGINNSGADGTIALSFMILCYLLHTTGELCLSPIGLSAVTKLSPKKWVGFCMGAWFLTIANAHLFAALIAKLTGGGDGEKLTGKLAVLQYANIFQNVAWIAFGAAALLVLLTPMVKKLMGDVK